MNLVKISDDGIDEEYELDDLPALVFFKSGKSHVFYGDLKQEIQIVQWIEKQNKLKWPARPVETKNKKIIYFCKAIF